MSSLGLGLSLSKYVPSPMDMDVQAFAAESGATDLAGLNSLVKYLKAESLYDNFVIYPMKSAQNAGSGSKAFSLGGLTTNDMTFPNGGTWATTGFTIDGVNQYGTMGDFLGGGPTYAFCRQTFASIPSGVERIASQWQASDNNRSWIFDIGAGTNTTIRVVSSDDGTDLDADNVDAGNTFTVDTCWVMEILATGVMSAWSNKINLINSLAGLGGLFDTSVDVMWGASDPDVPAQFADAEGHAQAFMSGVVLTTTQRETITDFINAL